MMNDNNMIDVTETNFEYEVVAYSRNNVVIVDFWAEWCQPCKTLSQILEKVLIESQDGFRLARLDVDHNPNIATQFGIRSLPTLKAFSGGQVVGELVGNQPEPRVRDFLSKLTPPSPIALKLEQVEGLLNLRNWQEAEDLCREILSASTGNPAALLGLTIALLGQGESLEPLEIIENFPASKEFPRAKLLMPYARALHDYYLNRFIRTTDLNLAFSNCVRLARSGKYEQALDGLMDILRQNKRYRDGLAQKVILSLLEIIAGSEDTVRQYRTELASILF